MNQSRTPLLIFILFLVLGVYWLQNKEQSLKKENPDSAQKLYKQSYTRQSINKSSSQIKNAPALNAKNIKTMTLFLKQSILQPDLKLTLQRLQTLQTSPSYSQDSNPDTGSFYIIRTDKPLKGTRYFHAQYFSDHQQKPFLQHMSFEIPPGKTSFAFAAETVKSIFPKLSIPSLQQDGFMMWKWQAGYNVWIQRLSTEDLLADPFNAYTAEDEGTVRIAIELDQPQEH
ncbi:hypothetical protein K2X05_04835 [bacterium]|nr:hypothetical protein [bacterium]